jgi:chemotaxis protein MotB
MSRRKRGEEEHENHERWLVSYADFITLLFAFFVVMYSISQVNEGKYRVLAETLDTAFNVDPLTQLKKPALSLDPIQIGDPVLRPKIAPLGIQLPDTGQNPNNNPEDGELTQELDDMKGLIESGFSELINHDILTINGNNNRLEIELKSNVLFEPAGAIIQYEAEHVLARLALVLDGYNNEILVEGHTDNIPIKTYHFPSNWELSSARAAAVVSLFIREGVDPERMSVIGYGEFRPIADNNTESGRTKNRRVVVVVMKDAMKRTEFDLERKNMKEVEDISLLDEQFESIPPIDILEIINEKVQEDGEPESPVDDFSEGLFLLPGLEGSSVNTNKAKIDNAKPEGANPVKNAEPNRIVPKNTGTDEASSGKKILRAVPLEGGGMIFRFDPE